MFLERSHKGVITKCMSSNDLLVWHGVSPLSFSVARNCFQGLSQSLCLNHTVPSASCKSFQAPQARKQPSTGDKAFCILLVSTKADPGDLESWGLQKHLKEQHIHPQERSSGETPVIWTHLKGKRLLLYFWKRSLLKRQMWTINVILSKQCELGPGITALLRTQKLQKQRKSAMTRLNLNHGLRLSVTQI